MTAREEALVPGSLADEDIVRLDLLETEGPPAWRDVAAPKGRSRRQLLAAISVAQVLTDAAVAIIALWIASAAAPVGVRGGARAALVLAAPTVWLAVLCSFGLYRPLRLPALEEFRRTLGATACAALLVSAGALVFVPAVSSSWLLWMWSAGFGLQLAGRGVWRRSLERSRVRGALRLRTLVVGEDPEATRLGAELRSQGSGFEVLGCVADRTETSDDLAVVGGLAELRRVVSRLAPDCLFVAPGGLDPEREQLVAHIARVEGISLRYFFGLPFTLVSRIGLDQLGGGVALSVSSTPLAGVRAAVKRSMDLSAAVVGLVVASPVLVVTAIAIKLTSRGPLLYRQTRVTKGGRTFTVLKFRTMRRDAEQLTRELEVDRTQPFFKLQADPRLTAVGRLIRRLSLDELPQLFNILWGDMSLVGPRPLPAEQVAENLNLLGPRHEVRAGLTGWWQIKGRADLTPEESVRLDRFYIENWSPSLDLYIMVKTVGAVLSRRGAY